MLPEGARAVSVHIRLADACQASDNGTLIYEHAVRPKTGFGVCGLGFRIWDLGLRVWGMERTVRPKTGPRVYDLGFGVWGLGFGVWGLGCRV